jgi:phosphoribosylaminoimidazole-succinocarboxamide synthase
VTTLAELPLIASGKVREMYSLSDDALLMVASDRISTYDAVHPTPIPDKGRVLTGLSAFWFEKTGHIVANHMISATDGVPAEARGRALAVRRLQMLPVECVVRGYITGSGWKDYQATGRVSGIELGEGLRESERLGEPIFTPSTKAEEGHDEAIDFERAVELVGDRGLMERVRDVSVELYSFASEHARANGVILADTKFELGEGLRESERLGEPIFTPSTKAEEGHDEAIDFERAVELVGDRGLMERVRDVSVELYSFASEHARANGVILADTKFELGLDDSDSAGAGATLVLGDEALTPDSSRYWPAEGFEVGRSQPSFDKQYVRDWAAQSGWDKRPPAPSIPPDVVAGTRARYIEAYELITGEPFQDWLDSTAAA